ncbi:restriction endonuclease subunit S [Psychrobacter sp. F1192]|uniref:Restriction endonuclease subunit S n=1 Tax=Psychrobacter coccoides TaxID=2818440 RepID=A0ABS3NPV7_9GAMM|nr:restriction endonuclease subunit S [Psychrobacter coccoides]MBO1531456.1 restriction endonuclease subunit S [Psychrobacter coccoides]
MVPNKPQPSQLGIIPDDWQRVKFLDVMKVRQGLQIAISKRLKEPTETSKEYITIQSIKQAQQSREYVERPSERVICTKDDVLMTRTGNTGIVVTDIEGAFHNNFFLMDFDKSKIDKTFLVNYLRSPRVQHLILTKAGSSTIPDLNHKDFYSIEFPLPPLPEQQKIAKILSTWDKAIDSTERLIDNSKQQKKALMQQLLTGKKRLLDDNGEQFEGEWEEVKLGELGSTFNGLTGKTKVDFGSGEKYIPYINIFRNTFIDTDNLDFVNIGSDEKQNAVQFGDIFFTTSSETPEEVGMSSVFTSDTKENIYLNSFCFGFRLQPLERVSPFFIGYMLRSSKIRRKISILAQGSTRFNLSKRQLVKITIPLPPVEEQQKIAAVLTNADKEIELLEQQLADLQQEKKALMQVLLTGKKRVRIDG